MIWRVPAIWVVLLSGVATGAAPGVGERLPAQWLGDGSGVFADYKGPTSWNITNNVNIRWTFKLPNWCNGSPIAVSDRVFVMSEPLDYAPTLFCLDAATGKEMWKKDLDAVEALPDAERGAARKLAQEGWAWKRRFMVLSLRMHEFWVKNKAQFNGKEPGPAIKAEWDKFLAEGQADGIEFKGFGQSAGGYVNNLAVKSGSPADERNRRLREMGLTWSQWYYQGTWDGVAFPTPCSDGKAVYTVTAHNLYTAFDLNGLKLWMRRFPPATLKDLTPEQKQRVTAAAGGKTRWPGGWPGAGHFSTSPILAGNRLISCAGMWVRCLDTKDGKVVWEYPMRGEIGQNMANPAVMTLGTTQVVIVPGNENRVGERGDDVIWVADGKVLGVVPGWTAEKMAVAGAIVDGDVVYHFDGTDWRDKNITATRLALAADGTSVTATKVWQVAEKERRGFGMWRTVVKDGFMYNSGCVLDAKTGAMVKDRLPVAHGGYCWNGGIIVGDSFLSMDLNGGRFLFRDLKTHAVKGQGALPTNLPDGASELQKRGEAHSAQWSHFGGGSPFAYKDRLYIRGYEALWCIGK